MNSGSVTDLVRLIRQSYSLDFGAYGKYIGESADFLVKGFMEIIKVF